MSVSATHTLILKHHGHNHTHIYNKETDFFKEKPRHTHTVCSPDRKTCSTRGSSPLTGSWLEQIDRGVEMFWGGRTLLGFEGLLKDEWLDNSEPLNISHPHAKTVWLIITTKVIFIEWETVQPNVLESRNFPFFFWPEIVSSYDRGGLVHMSLGYKKREPVI